MISYKAPRGTQDVLPSSTPRWQYVETRFRAICKLFGFNEIRTPTFEETELFTRHTGGTTDIVTKQMYTFQDQGGRSLTLRPEGTPPTVRAYLENNLAAQSPVSKLYYFGRIFRYERPQSGRYREHNQMAVEMIGSPEPTAEAEVISLAWQFLKSLGIEQIDLRLNSIGGPEDRPAYREALRNFAAPFLSELCPTCQVRYEQNPLRMLDCKDENCKKLFEGAPGAADYLSDASKAHFEAVQRYLTSLGVSYTLDSKLVRGLDYYTHTIFEFQTPLLGAQNTICGGGRYNNMVEEMGGPATPALGFGMGMERLLLTLEKLGIDFDIYTSPTVFVAALGSAAKEASVSILSDLRKSNISCDSDFTGKSLKSQMKLADKLGAKLVLIIGDDEVRDGIATLRDMSSKEQRQISMESVVEAVKSAIS